MRNDLDEFRPILRTVIAAAIYVWRGATLTDSYSTADSMLAQMNIDIEKATKQ